MPDSQNLILTAQFKSLDRVRDFVGKQAEKIGLGDSAVYQVQLAVDEAFTNIIEHAYGGECKEQIQCTCRITDKSLEIILQDYGHIFDPLAIPDPDFNAELEDREVGGLGLYFIRQLMDEVEFTFQSSLSGSKGSNILRMVKHKE